ncbi:hypothetical protein OGAPHI_005940 [Ogataea philodendri]|uniref:ATP-dependent DNA helicase PIF1 n=1 Tax=Ogataea philodendri TaxID=1378263 RepID=A0A9P8NYE8_9ASCO|nr:uncharacterized protein OGAPHI_005940 [Ogataea philodendri]KAH3661762.1 hypothetical protein OGAPHI_005940 [Ogataea philodendri]
MNPINRLDSSIEQLTRAGLSSGSQERVPKISSADLNYSFTQEAEEEEGVISIEEIDVQECPNSTPTHQSASSVADSSPVDHRTRVLYPELKRRQRDSPHWTQGTHAGVTLDHIREYLTWFGTLSPSNKHVAETTVTKIQKYFEKTKDCTDNKGTVDISSDKSPGSIFSDPRSKAIMDTPIKRERNANTGIKLESIHTMPLNQNTSLVNKPLEVKRMMSTSVSRNAKLELLTQKENLLNDSKSAPELAAKKPTEEKRVQAITLSEEQNQVIDLARQGHNLFYTGSAGTGKSLLLRSLIKALKAQHSNGTVGVTASTGLAACNVGGQTLHSFTGIGLGEASVDILVRRVKRNPRMKRRWKELEVLIIDEISMIEAELFDKLDQIARQVRSNDKPFGGIQLVICGDFYQLPPVTKGREPSFAFDSHAWKRAIKYTIVLTKVYRQQSDRDFIDMLNEVRNGNVSFATTKKFRALSRPLASKEGVTPAQLFPTRREVDSANSTMLRQLPGAEIVFRAFDSGYLEDEEQKERLLANFLAPERIALKKNAQVMLIKNMDETLVNGSLGKVVDFIDPDTYAHYRTLESGEFDIDEVQRKSESNKAMSEDNQEDKNLIENYNDMDNDLDEDVFSFLKEMKPREGEEFPASVTENIERKTQLLNRLYRNSKDRRMPLVRFIQADGTTREVLIEPEHFSMEDEFDKPIVARTQIPLILAWSLSIHKSQGQTLPFVRINLRNIFERGQAYVALSRATHRRGLQVMNFNPSRILTHERVVKFYESLQTIEQIKSNEEQTKEQRKSEYVSDTQLDKLENLAELAADPNDFMQGHKNVVDEFDSIWAKN